MKRPRLKVSNPYDLLEDAIRGGVTRGYRRAFKHHDAPTEEQIVEAVTQAVQEQITEAFLLEAP